MKDYFDLQNEKFFDFLEDTFNFKKSKNWEDIAKSITIVKMKRTYRVFAELYPRKFDYLNELKKADRDFSTLHWGNLRGSNIIQDVSRFSLYSEKIIVFHPLQNPAVTNPNIDPGRNPKKWIPDFLEALYFYIVIQKWVRSGIVKIIINPIDYDFELRDNFFKMTTDRINSVGTGKLFAEQKDEFTDAMAYQFAHAFKGSKEKVIADLLALRNPVLEHEEATDLAERMINQREFLNPLYNNLNIPMTGGMIFSSKGGGSMEAIQMLAEATGSSIFTPDKANWGQLKRLDNLDFWSKTNKVYSNIPLNFLNNVDSSFALEIRQEERLSGIRMQLKKMYSELNSIKAEDITEMKLRDLHDAFIHEIKVAESEWDLIKKKAEINRKHWLITSAVAQGVVAVNDISILPAFIGASAMWLYKNESIKNKELKHQSLKNPVSVFVDLKNQRQGFMTHLRNCIV